MLERACSAAISLLVVVRSICVLTACFSPPHSVDRLRRTDWLRLRFGTSQLHRRKRLAKVAGTSGRHGAALQQRHYPHSPYQTATRSSARPCFRLHRPAHVQLISGFQHRTSPAYFPLTEARPSWRIMAELRISVISSTAGWNYMSAVHASSSTVRSVLPL